MVHETYDGIDRQSLALNFYQTVTLPNKNPLHIYIVIAIELKTNYDLMKRCFYTNVCSCPIESLTFKSH